MRGGSCRQNAWSATGSTPTARYAGQLNAKAASCAGSSGVIPIIAASGRPTDFGSIGRRVATDHAVGLEAADPPCTAGTDSAVASARLRSVLRR
jgi:hypothetical protein